MTWSRTNLLLLLVSGLAAIPRIYLGLTAHTWLDYDGYWHLFIARQDNWDAFLREYHFNVHPPLVFLLLKTVSFFSHHLLVYRSVSILTGVASVFLVGKITQKVCSHPPVAPIAALAFGLSWTSTKMSLGMQAYMLCIFFILLALYYYLESFPPESGPRRTRAQIAFSAFTVLAFLSHYCAGFFFFACLVAPVFTAFIYSEYRRRLVRQPIRNWFSYVFMSLPILTVMFYSYFSHAARHVTRQVHLASYYFQPSGEESVGSFVLRNLRNTFNVFSPVSLENEIIVLSLSLVLLTAAFVCVIGFRPEKGYVLATVPLILLVTIAGSLIAASILGLYPFGGAGRHQFVLYPFMVLSGAVVLDRLLSSTRRSAVRFAILAIGVVGVLVNSTVQLWVIRPWRDRPLFSREMEVYRQNIPADVVFLDRFNSIIFFSHHHEWAWSFDGTLGRSVVDQYSLTANGGKLVVFRDRGRFTINFLERRPYHFLRRCLESTGSRSIGVFHRNRHGRGESRSKKEEEEFKSKVIAAAAAEKLSTQKLVLDGYNVYAAFGLDGGAGENLRAR